MAQAIRRSAGPSFGVLIFLVLAFGLGVYFTFAAVQGDFGLFRRVELTAQAQTLQGELDRLNRQIAEMENLTKRLSDGYLDLDLLDQQARSILGLLRTDELVVR